MAFKEWKAIDLTKSERVKHGIGFYAVDESYEQSMALAIAWAFEDEPDGHVKWNVICTQTITADFKTDRDVLAAKQADGLVGKHHSSILTVHDNHVGALVKMCEFIRSYDGMIVDEASPVETIPLKMRDIENEMMGVRELRAILIDNDKEPCETRLECDRNGSDLKALQMRVGDTIAPFDVLFDDFGGVTLYINDNGLVENKPNRAIFATEKMAEMGYLSQMDHKSVVKPGDLYTVINGPIVAVGFNPETGENVSLTDEQAEKVTDYFTRVSDPGSGELVVMLMRMRVQMRRPA